MVWKLQNTLNTLKETVMKNFHILCLKWTQLVFAVEFASWYPCSLLQATLIVFFFQLKILMIFCNVLESLRQERPPHLRPHMIHPALREKGRAIPHSHIVPRVTEPETPAVVSKNLSTPRWFLCLCAVGNYEIGSTFFDLHCCYHVYIGGTLTQLKWKRLAPQNL